MRILVAIFVVSWLGLSLSGASLAASHVDCSPNASVKLPVSVSSCCVHEVGATSEYDCFLSCLSQGHLLFTVRHYSDLRLKSRSQLFSHASILDAGIIVSDVNREPSHRVGRRYIPLFQGDIIYLKSLRIRI